MFPHAHEHVEFLLHSLVCRCDKMAVVIIAALRNQNKRLMDSVEDVMSTETTINNSIVQSPDETLLSKSVVKITISKKVFDR